MTLISKYKLVLPILGISFLFADISRAAEFRIQKSLGSKAVNQTCVGEECTFDFGKVLIGSNNSPVKGEILYPDLSGGGYTVTNRQIIGSQDFNLNQFPPARFNWLDQECITKAPMGSCTFITSFNPTSVGPLTLDFIVTVHNEAAPGYPAYDQTFTYHFKGEGVSASVKNPAKDICGSIISPENQTLRESIPVSGCDFDLFYTTTSALGYSSLIPLVNRVPSFNPEGWTASVHHYYDIPRRTLNLGNGATVALPYTLSGSSYFVVSSDGSEVFVFDSSGKHLSTKSALTGATKYSFTYNTSNYLTAIQDAFGNQTTLNRDSSNKLTSIQSPYGVTTAIGTNSAGLISSVQNPKSETYSLTYKSGTELLETYQKPGGQISTFTYDLDGKLTKDLSHGGNFWSFVAGGTPGQVTMASALNISTGYQSNFNIDGSGFSGTVSEPLLTHTRSQNSNGDTTDSAEGVTATTTYTNDERFGAAFSRVTSNVVSFPSASLTETRSQAVSWPSGVTADWFNYSTITTASTISSQSVTSVFDASTKTNTTTTPEGATSSVTIDSNERPVSSQTGSDTSWSYSYDTHGRISQVIQGTNNGLTYAYNSSGYLQSITNLRGEVVSYAYDLAGRITQVTLPDSRIITYSYDSNGNLTSVTPPSKPLHGMTFNAMELISTYSPPTLSGLTTKDTTYTYNLDKQLTQITRPTGDTVGFTYSSTTGLLTTTTVAAGNFSYTYLSKNRISQANSPDDYYNALTWYGTKLLGDAQWKTSTNFLYGKASYTYDNQHRVSSRTFRGNSATNTFTRNYTYNNDSQITQAGSLSLTYTYPSGRLNTTSIDKISDSRTYDSYGNIQSYTAVYTPTSGSPQTLYSYTLSRDSMGRISGKSETVLGVTDAYTYSYDTAGRLTTVLKNGSAYSSYVYDSNGNRTSGTTAGTAFTGTYDDQDRILTYNSRTYSYNANGDLTHIQWSPTVDSSYVYDALGDLRQATLSTGNILTYGYDGLDRRVHKLDGTTLKYHYIFEDGDRIVGHVNINGVIQREYIYATNFRVPDYLVASGVNYRLVKDHLGSIRLVVKTDDGTITQRLDYNDLGEAVTDTNAGFQAFGFAGGIYDGQTKFVKFGDRDYDPRAAGRWTSKDPVVFGGGDANLYGYTFNDPINYIDINGQFGVGAYKLKDGAITGGGAGIGTIGIILAQEAGDDPCPMPPKDPTQAPGDDWKWRGKGPPGSKQGSWVRPGPDGKPIETLYPDLDHPAPIGPHWDYKDREGKKWRIFPDGRKEPKR